MVPRLSGSANLVAGRQILVDHWSDGEITAAIRERPSDVWSRRSRPIAPPGGTDLIGIDIPIAEQLQQIAQGPALRAGEDRL